MVRIKDIAERAGVSATTVSNVIHHKAGKVSPELVEKIERIIREMNYVPSLSARMLANESSGILGVAVGYPERSLHLPLEDPFVASLIGHLEHAIRELGYYMMLLTKRSMEEILQESRAWNFDGLIAFGFFQEEFEALREAFDKPIVTIDSYFDRRYPRVCNVGTDDFDGGYQIGRFLLSRGHRDILFVADNDLGVDHLRWEGFRKAMAEAGLEHLDDMRLMVPWDYEPRLRRYDELLGLLRRQTALFFCSDYNAVEAMNHLRRRGVDIPGELSVAGFDDIVYARTCWPPLTTVHQPVDKKAALAVEMLGRMLRGERVDGPEPKVSVHVVERQSVCAR